MKRARWPLVALLAGVVSGVALVHQWLAASSSRDDASPAASAAPDARPPTAADRRAQDLARPASPTPSGSAFDSALAQGGGRPLDAHARFREQMSALIAHAEQLSVDERQAQAQALERQIREFEDADHVLPLQARMLRALLARVASGDPKAYEERMAALERDARAAEEAREREVTRQSAAYNAEYQPRAAAIVEEIMTDSALAADPARRDAALRARLEALRVDLQTPPAN